MKFCLKILQSIFLYFLMINQSLLAMHASKPLKINPQYLKGTHEILADTNYAPVWGLTIIDNELAQSWYELSSKQQNKEIISTINNAPENSFISKEELLKLVSERKNAPIQDLVLQMFHIAGGTFTLTNALNNPVSQFTPKIIGQILRKVHDTKIYDDAFLKSIEDFLVTLNLKDPSNKNFKAKDFRPFAKALTASLQEFIQNNKIPSNIVQSLFLGFMLCKCNTKADLESYFSGFEGKSVNVSHEIYSLTDFENIIENNSNLVEFANSADFVHFADFICASIYQNKYAANLPKMTTSTQIKYQQYSFTDCVETVMFNLANIATYNPQKNRLGLIDNPSMNPELAQFYQKNLNSNPGEINNTTVHNDWALLIENIPGAAYNRIGISGNETSIQIRSEYAGAIPVPLLDPQLPIEEILINNQSFQCNVVNINEEKYLLVPQNYNLTCFELMPTISNIVVIMNHLFDLKIIDNLQDTFQPDFALKQFKNLCEKFSWSIYTNLENIAQNKNFDLKIFTKENVPFTIYLKYKVHGYISVENKKQITEINNPAIQNLNRFNALLSCGFISYTNHNKSYWYNPISNQDQRHKFLKTLKNPSDNVALLSYYGNLIINMANSSDQYYYNLNYSNEIASLEIITKSLFIMAYLCVIKYENIEPFIENFNLFTKGKLLNIDQAKLSLEKSFQLFEKNFESYNLSFQIKILELIYQNYKIFDKEFLNKCIDWVIEPQKFFDRSTEYQAWDLLFKINNPNECWQKIKLYLNNPYDTFHDSFLLNRLYSLLISNSDIFKNLEKIDQIILWLKKHIQQNNFMAAIYIIFAIITTESISITTDQAQSIMNLIQENKECFNNTLDSKNFPGFSNYLKFATALNAKMASTQTRTQSILNFARKVTGALRATNPKLMNYNPLEYQRMQQTDQELMRKQRDDLQNSYDERSISAPYGQNQIAIPKLHQQSQNPPLPLQVPKMTKQPSILFKPKVSNIKSMTRMIK
ncbi:hypothetical protein KBB68_03275 [Candidatus Babeliales bacterium]|nr:hypothetical protein [Candidatus Babeliales bacterium]